MQFEMLRLSVLPRPQIDGFERRKLDGSPFTREEWLKAVFAERVTFIHKGVDFYYVPASEADTHRFIAGRIGRPITSVENAPPGGNLVKTRRESWRAALALIDPSHHEDGQKVAMEHLGPVGRPVPVFQSLVEQINFGAEPFLIEANAISPSETFWTFVEENHGEVTYVEFEFVAPNMFGGEEDYDAEMRDMKEQERVQKAKLALESRDGLNLNTNRVRTAVAYTSRGTGSIKARTKRKRTYNSKAKAEKVTIPDIDLIDTEEKT